MAAYAALVSLMHIIDQIKLHPRPPISLDKIQVESLTENVTFLQEFLEGYSHVAGYRKEADGLESRIADTAYATEDIIESHIVDRILAGSTSHGEKISSVDFYQDLQKAIGDMDSIKKEVMEIKEKTGVQDQLRGNSTPAGSLRASSTGQNIIVGFDDVLIQIMDKLTGQQSSRQIIPIVGMGGIGKTTLARKIYRNRVVVQHFDILAWVTISQEYCMREILLQLLQEGEGSLSQMNEYELGDKLHKRLSGRRYLIIMDDIWDIEVWDQLKLFFPDNNNGSRIMLTTRLSNLASQVADRRAIDMAFLDEDHSWDLFSKTVFGREGCPLELEEIGKTIVKNCKGLPLSIVVVGGLLAKSKLTQEYWEYIAENLNSVVNSEDNESCLKILHLSYNHLPIYLKSCFLYMGVFPEDHRIHVSTLIKLWVAEGFLKPVSGKTLEEIAEENLKELINRNLVLVNMLGRTGEIKYCSIHDLVRDLCLREAGKERFYNVVRQHSLNLPQGINTQRRIIIHEKTLEYNVLDALQSVSLARSLICDIRGVLPISTNLRLLRILKTFDGYAPCLENKYFLENMFQLLNSRYLAVGVCPGSKFPSSLCLPWNLHTLVAKTDLMNCLTAPVEIWNMPQLRHVKFRGGLYLPGPPNRKADGRDDIVLGNLQTLERIRNFKCGEEVVKRIPNIKKLRVDYEKASSRYYLNNLHRLHKLEYFHCSFSPAAMPRRAHFLRKLTFPHSLKKLGIAASHVHWEDMLEKIGSLPFLEKLHLFNGRFRGRKWETVEGQFRSLKFLLIHSCIDLECWETDSSHFPLLERLFLSELQQLKEIPSEIGEIPTLQSIQLSGCSHSAALSAKKILEEQEELHGEAGLQVRVGIRGRNEALRSSASPNFQVEYLY